MNNVFDYLLEIEDPAELRLALAILAASAAHPHTRGVHHGEVRSLTGWSAPDIAKAVDRMLARGLITRIAGRAGGEPTYRITGDRTRWGRDFGFQQGWSSGPVRGAVCESERLRLYFTDTGFIDLLPHALGIANNLGYNEEEMIQAVCLVFDRQRTDPPVRNRTAWFRTVFNEKLGESRAQILAFRRTAKG